MFDDFRWAWRTLRTITFGEMIQTVLLGAFLLGFMWTMWALFVVVTP